MMLHRTNAFTVTMPVCADILLAVAGEVIGGGVPSGTYSVDVEPLFETRFFGLLCIVVCFVGSADGQ